jgi:exopolysaccharide production protein ExoQ
MSPGTATVVVVLGIVGLFVLDRDARSRTSKALWIPVCWMLIAGSRTVSQWLGLAPTFESAGDILEGSPLDRNVFTWLIVAGLVVVVRRRREIVALLRRNWPIVLFFLYCAASIGWSDYSDVALKRWTKAVGDLVMVLIVLTDVDRVTAVKRFLARIAFPLMPLSILLIKYYPELGRGYDRWEGRAQYTGVTTDKNMLGMICLVSGLGAVWRLGEAFRGREDTRRSGSLMAQGALLVMVLWLFWIANSMTSLACFLLASIVMMATNLSALARRRALLHGLVLATLCVPLIVLFMDVGGQLVGMIGRDATLTGRT